jgi:peptide deformylase
MRRVEMPIRTLGDPVLREPSKPVERFDRTLRRLFEDMVETMYAASGVGLAAPQVGLSLQLFSYDDGETGPSLLANPELTVIEGETTVDEGCLSIPGPYYPTQRAEFVRIAGQDVKGERVEIEAEGLLARIFQHESDHVHGMLFIDRLDDEGRRAVMTELRQIEMGLVEPRKKRRQDEG